MTRAGLRVELQPRWTSMPGPVRTETPDLEAAVNSVSVLQARPSFPEIRLGASP